MQRVLLIRLTALGDVVLVEPVVRALRRAVPGLSVDLVTEARFAPLMSGAGVDAVIPYDRHGADRGLFGLRRVLARLPRGTYDAVIDLQGKLRTRLLARLVRARRRVTFEKRSFCAALLALLGRDPPLERAHAVDLYLGALSPLRLELQSGEALAPEIRLARGALPAPGKSELRIGLGIGTTHATKRWPAERFASLAEALTEALTGSLAGASSDARRAARFVVIGGPPDRGDLQAVRAAVKKADIDPLDVSALDVAGLAAEIGELDLMISVDSGPAHLAAALGVPTVVLFGPTSPARWGPRGGRHRVVTLGLPCSPCSNIGGRECPLPDRSHACMRDLDVTRVVQAALELAGAAKDAG